MDNFSFLKDFPSSFIFGAATSSYQIEGNQYGGCGKSIWDDFAKRKLNGIDGLNACNHYEYFEEDIKVEENINETQRVNPFDERGESSAKSNFEEKKATIQK